MRKLNWTLILASVAFASQFAFADIAITTGVSPFEENLLFEQPGTINGPAPLITGSTNKSGTVLIIDNAGTDLEAFGSGQARFQAATGLFSMFTLSLPTGTLDRLIFNINSSGHGNTTGTVNFNVLGSGLTLTTPTSFSVGPGQNFFTVDATNGQHFTGVTAMVSGEGVAIQDVRQIRLNLTGSTIPPTNVTPEPATWGLMGAGVLAILLVRRRRTA